MRSLLLSFLFLAGMGHADSVNTSSTVTAKISSNAEIKAAFVVGQDNTQALRPLLMDSNGNLIVALSITSTGAPQSVTMPAGVYLTLAGSAVGASNPVPVYVTAPVTVGGFVCLSATVFTATTHTVTTLALTQTASYNGGKPLSVKLSSDAAFRWEITNSATPPTYLSNLVGSYQAASTTAIIPLDMSTNNFVPYLHAWSSGATADALIVTTIYRKE